MSALTPAVVLASIKPIATVNTQYSTPLSAHLSPPGQPLMAPPNAAPPDDATMSAPAMKRVRRFMAQASADRPSAVPGSRW
jgi:hypothetical protein